uniref:Putative reverse transcriptase-RNase H-integrase n=1 Tax=Moniliophthora roreri TaxID=221103 RepID=A0A0W0FPM1_MONRR
MTKPSGPAHPLPVPDGCGTSVALDFVGLLPEENGFNCLLSMTCRLGSDIHLVPCCTNISAEEAATLFFDHWYCENGLPLEIIVYHDKLWTSTFWKTLQQLSGVQLALSSSFHPETDGSSERSNKMLVQSIRFYVDRAQHGWVWILPRIRFAIMNTTNASTGFSDFQLRLGCCPWVIPPLTDDPLLSLDGDAKSAADVIETLRLDTMEAQDALLHAKVSQAHQINKHCAPDHTFTPGDKFNGPYIVDKAHPELSTYMLNIPNAHKNTCLTFHSSLLKPWTLNDDDLFPQRKHQCPGPIVTENGIEEWIGYAAEDDEWLPGKELDECAALDVWLSQHPH